MRIFLQSMVKDITEDSLLVNWLEFEFEALSTEKRL